MGPKNVSKMSFKGYSNIIENPKMEDLENTSHIEEEFTSSKKDF